MFESIVDLILTTFIVAIPVLTLIMRGRRRRQGQVVTDTPEGQEAAERMSPIGEPRHPPAPERTSAGERQQGSSHAVERAPDKIKARAIGTDTARPAGRDTRWRRLGATIGEPAAGDSAWDRINSLPPLKRGIALKEILGPPRGLDPW